MTHGHQDHISDLPELANLTGATVVANYELANNLVGVGVLDATKTIVGMNKGGTLEPLGPGIKVHMVQAEHTSSVDMKRLKPEWTGPPFLDSGAAVGYVIEFENGFKIYHTGDTDVFGDMGLIGRFFKPDLVLICIGGHFTMDPEHAAFALRELIRSKQVIPMHYGTFPVINAGRAQGGTWQRADQDARREAGRGSSLLTPRRVTRECPPSQARRQSAWPRLASRMGTST